MHIAWYASPILTGPSLHPRHVELAAGFFEKAVVDNLRNRERLSDFGIFTHHVDHQLHAFGFDRHIANDAAAKLLQHLAREPSVVQLPLLHDDVDDLFAIPRIDTENETTKRGAHHGVDFVRVVLNLFHQSAETVLRKIDNVAQEKQFAVAFLHGDDIFRHAEERRVHRSALQSRQPVASKRNHTNVESRVEAEVFERGVGHQRCRPARCAARDFLPLEITRRSNTFSDDERLQRPVDGARENFGRRAAHDALNDTVHRGAVVDVAADEGRIHRLCRHENRFQFNSLFAIESLMISGVKWQKADVGGLNPHPDFLDWRLRVDRCIRNEDRRDEKPKRTNHHSRALLASVSQIKRFSNEKIFDLRFLIENALLDLVFHQNFERSAGTAFFQAV